MHVVVTELRMELVANVNGRNNTLSSELTDHQCADQHCSTCRLLSELGARPGGKVHVVVTDLREELVAYVNGSPYLRRELEMPSAALHHAGQCRPPTICLTAFCLPACLLVYLWLPACVVFGVAAAKRPLKRVSSVTVDSMSGPGHAC